jgi:hypothetical protein
LLDERGMSGAQGGTAVALAQLRERLGVGLERLAAAGSDRDARRALEHLYPIRTPQLMFVDRGDGGRGALERPLVLAELGFAQGQDGARRGAAQPSVGPLHAPHEHLARLIRATEL